MEPIRQKSILESLSNRANRFRNVGTSKDVDDHLVSWALDETGTLDVTIFDKSKENVEELERTERMERIRVSEAGIPDDVLKVHGSAPKSKGEGITRLIYENVNGLNNRLCDNEDVEKAKEIHDFLEVDIVAYNEHRLNMAHKSNVNGFNQLFKGGEAAIQSVVAHNVHENIGRIQEGGTSLIMFGPLTEHLQQQGQTKDETGLGRWSIMTLEGVGVRTRIVCGYNPCYNNSNNPNSSTTYQQHRRYFRPRNEFKCPRTLFREHLINMLSKWRAEGDRLIVCLDANEDIYNKSIGQALTDIDGLAMKEVVGEFTRTPLGTTFFRGSKPIDGIWATSDLTVSNASVMPAGYGIGDHRLFVIDFATQDLVGTHPPKVVRPTSRRLNTKLPGVANRYTKTLEELILKHRLIERTGEVYLQHKSTETFTRKLNALDSELGDYMRHAEKKCRKIKSGRIPFSPEAALWIRRMQVYRSLLKFHAGRIRNRSNLKRAGIRCGIDNPLALSIREIYLRLQTCTSQCEYFRQNGRYHRKKHLYSRLSAAQEREDEAAAAQILSIIQREKERCFWRRINYALGKPRGGACFKVQVERGDGDVDEFVEKEALHRAIWDNIHKKRFVLAEDAPLCQRPLRGMFGYCAVSITAQSILSGKYNYPDNFDQATREILEECARIRLTIPIDAVSTVISPTQWASHWRKAKETTSSSISGRHFGHYKAGTKSPYICYLQALLATLIAKQGIVLDRWAQGLSVMLEKIFGCSLITKLRSILLMEGDFNASNKLVFGIGMLEQARKYKMMPEEVFSERNRLAEDGTLSKNLFYDIVRQLRVPAGLASVDADNCYDRIAHPMASMVFQAFGVPTPAIVSMLTTIQDMRFYLRTGYGDSQDYAGGKISGTKDPIKPQGMCQGNGASPAAWAVTTIPMIRAHRKKGHGAFFIAPISRLKECQLIGGLFVDDTDIIHVDMRTWEDLASAHQCLQVSVDNWGQLLIATGGALKPAKCSYYLISFRWKKDGTWEYQDNTEDDELGIVVPMADGSKAQIEQLPVTKAIKTLGSMTCPTGCNKAALERMQQQGQEWVDRVISGKISRRNMWKMLDCQFWPRLGYAIGNNSASLAEFEKCLQRIYWQIVPRGGVRGSAPKHLRTLNKGFYGIGCPHPGIECMIAQVAKLLTHYGCRSGVGIQLQVSMELLIIELGLSAQPLQEPFEKYGKRVTHSWIKSIWEKVSKYKVRVELGPLSIDPPRERDRWFMEAVESSGITNTSELNRINRVRLYQQVMYVSDVLEANGKTIDSKYLEPRPLDEKWSQYTFPTENPPTQDFTLWRQVVNSLAPRGRIQHRIGKFISPGHKIWPWRYDTQQNVLFHLRGDQAMDVYTPAIGQEYGRRPNCWMIQSQNVPSEVRGDICSVRKAREGIINITSHSSQAPAKALPRDFWAVIEEWGELWIWEHLKVVGDPGWIEHSIKDNACTAVTDGSYMKHMYPDICSAAFIFECSKGRGRIIGYFAEQSPDAGSYRGELLGLMAIHLILRGVHEFNPLLGGSVRIISDCKGALHKVENMPPYQIPTKCSHPDILKNIMINCEGLSFDRIFSHVAAHQDDSIDYGELSREAQLNCQMDFYAKHALLEESNNHNSHSKRLPLEPICIFLGKNKLTSDNGDRLRFWAHKQVAKDSFYDSKIMFEEFDLVDWEMVYIALH